MPEESCEVNHPRFPRTNGPNHTRWQFCGTPVWRGAPGGRWQRTVILPFIRVSTVSTATSGASAALYTRFLPTPPKCTMSPKPIHPLKSLKIKNSAWHFLSTNEKSLNKQDIEKYIQKKWQGNRLQSILCLHIYIISPCKKLTIYYTYHICSAT